MNNRFGGPGRDRSPPARYDRRPSSNTFPSGGSSYRGTGDPAQPASDRGPPLGPKSDPFGPNSRYPYSPATRGRGGAIFAGRPPLYDRDRDRERDRDARPSQSYRSRDDDRPEWRRDRDLASAERTATTPRDSRPFNTHDRSASPVRARRDSRESLPALSRPSDAPPFYGPSARGGLARGRGRGDFDRIRGRNSFAGERDRDLFSNRSRSREGWRGDRDFDRGRAPVGDREARDRYDRRDHARSRDRETRSDHDTWARDRDHSPSRMSTGASVGRAASPVGAPSATTSHHGPAERSSKMDFEMTRRPSAVVTPGSLGRDRRDTEQSDYFGSRSEPPRRDGHSSTFQSQPAQSSAPTAGLDYGPPPSITTPIGDKPASSKVAPPNHDGHASNSPTFQPPSGPKAERIPPPSATNLPQKIVTQQEPLVKPEPLSRLSRPPPAGPAAIAATGDSSTKAGEIKLDTKPPLPLTPGKALPANVPLGPRSSLGAGFKPRQQAPENTVAASQPPRQISPESRGVVVPKGPRHSEGSWSTAGHMNRSATWISPDYSRMKPSIMNPLGRDRPSFAPPAGPRSQSILPPHSDKSRMFTVSSSQGPGTAPASSTMLRQKPSIVSAQGYGSAADRPSASEDVDMSLPASSDEEDEFDEDDFAASEEKHRKERTLLEARKPPPLLYDPGIRNLLIRIQFLNMITHDVVPKSLISATASDDKIKAIEPASIGLPSPKEMADDVEEKAELKHPQPRGRPLSQVAPNPIPTPPIEDLPFRTKQSPKFETFAESDDEVEHEGMTTLIGQKFEEAAFEWVNELQDIKAEFRQRYPLWKQDVMMLDHEHRDLQPSPAPASPAPSAAPSVTPSLSHERTRGARNTTEADLQQAILMSQQSLKEEEERREREAASNSQPNHDTEAVVPPMMKPSEVELYFFEDSNKLVPISLALETFAYIPPEDDFTEEEQLAFIQAYCQHPKKWGKIAESVPRRTYKDCITHYYLTKNDSKYKIMWRNSQPKRKRGRAANKPRSTALLSEMNYDAEGDGAVAVTDTGRPRRAAAPTFGDTPGDSDIATPVPQAKRLAISKELNGESVTLKPSRGRKAGAPARPRRTKAQIQADQQAATLLPAIANDGSPQKAAAVPRERSRTLLRAENGTANSDITGSPDLHRLADMEMGHYSLMEGDRFASAAAPAAANQPTSYWSVPEQQKFPQLIAYYGKDFASIAGFMKTKTAAMIKNYYNRQVADGKTDLEELARDADRRRQAGQPMGAPPSPAAQTKRRYEATPSTASISRPLQPDHGVSDTEPSSLVAKSTYTEDFPANAVQRGTAGVDLVPKSRPHRDILREAQPVTPAQAKIEEMQQRSQVMGQKPQTGPRPGFFKDESLGFGFARHGLQDSPHQHPIRPGEPRISELSHQSSLLGPPREKSGASAQISSALGFASMDKYGQSVPHVQHGRNSSLGMTVGSPSLQDTRDFLSLRRLESDPRQSPFIFPRSLPQTSAPIYGGILSRSDSGSTAPAPEQPKPAPVKRSNLMNLLNDEPPDPQPPKRASLDTERHNSLLSPKPVPVTSQSLSFEAARAQARSEELHGLSRGSRGIGHSPASHFGSIVAREPQSGSHADQNNERWMDRFDPRHQGGASEPRGPHQSPRVGGYSVVPPSNTPHPSHQSVRMESQRSIDAGHQDHRRMLSQMNHPGSNPSPPPQHTPAAIAPYRSLSGSSHNRFGSTGYGQTQPISHQSPHMQPLQQPPGPPSHPPSAGSTPAPSLHHQSRPSLDYPQNRRLTIQEHLAQRSQAQQAHHREREHDEVIRRQREMEAQQQAMRMPERDRDHHLHRHRDILGGFGSGSHHDPQPQSQHHQSQALPGHSQNQHTQQQHQQQQQQHHSNLAGMPGSRHLGFGQHPSQSHEPVTRTYTPPSGPFSLGHQHPSQPAAQHSHHPPSQHQHQHSHQHQHQTPHQQQQTQQGQQQQQQGQQQGFGQYAHGHGLGHFRTLSQGPPQQQGEGRDERR